MHSPKKIDVVVLLLGCRSCGRQETRGVSFDNNEDMQAGGEVQKWSESCVQKQGRLDAVQPEVGGKVGQACCQHVNFDCPRVTQHSRRSALLRAKDAVWFAS